MNPTNQPVQVTQAGYDALQAEHHDLTTNKRPQLVDRLANARSQGDLSENSDYQNAKDELEFLDGRIAELEDVIKNAKIVADGKNGGGVAVGTKVTVRVNNVEHTYQIVGAWEADPIKKKISHDSPLGHALINRQPGDRVEVAAPAGMILYEILSVE